VKCRPSNRSTIPSACHEQTPSGQIADVTEMVETRGTRVATRRKMAL
jgi:hypothetical protein